MNFFVQTIAITVLAVVTAFGGCKEDLDNAIAAKNDGDMMIAKLKEEHKKVSAENKTLTAEKEKTVKAANAEKDKAVAESEKLKTKNAELEKKNKELTENSAQFEANAGTLQTLAAENNRLATENMNFKNQLAAAPAVTVPVPPADKFSYPISGILQNKSVSGNVVVADFVFVNNGSKKVTLFDSELKFYYKEKLIYKISLPNVKNPAGSAFGRNESINFRAGLPITDQNLVNASVESIDLIVEVTKVQ
jgi:hypothetical protein